MLQIIVEPDELNHTTSANTYNQTPSTIHVVMHMASMPTFQMNYNDIIIHLPGQSPSLVFHVLKSKHKALRDSVNNDGQSMKGE